jgi:phasin family protein
MANTGNKEQIDRAAESVKKVADEMTRAGSDIARNGADTARQGMESGLNTARQGMESGLNSTVHTFQRVTDQFTQVLGFAGPQADEMARRSAQNLEAVSQASTVLTRGAQELSREWFDVMQDRLAKNMDAMNRLAGCRTLQDFLTVQSEITRDQLGEAVNTGRRIAEVSLRVADEAAKVIQAQAGRNVTEFDDAARARRVS